MRRNIYPIFIFLTLAFTACQDLYTPEIDKFPAALVVEGMLTDEQNVVKVKITRSASFSDKSYFYGVQKATVTIESASGVVWGTRETDKGVYQTTEPVSTVVGEGYFVRIVTVGGDEYRSEIEQMMAPVPIESIFLTDTVIRSLNYNYWGDPVVSSIQGIQISVLPGETEAQNSGFIYRWNALANYYVYTTEGRDEFNYYCWKSIPSTSVLIYDYYHDDFIAALPVGDLHPISYYRLSPQPIDSSLFEGNIFTAYSTSFYYQLKQFAISEKGTNYWRGIKNQSEASGKLFDPVEEQINGNIYCVSDTEKVAFGYFNVASYTNRVLAIKLKADKLGEIKIIDFMPELFFEDTCWLNETPDFWFF
jgi:hypothetical protein